MRRTPMLAFMSGGQTDRVGAFSPVVLTRILKRTADEGRSGALQVASGPSVKTVHFDHGSVRFAASNIRRDRLGESMLAHEFISREDYERAVAKMKNDRCRFGEALVSLGRLTEQEVHKELAIQVQRIVLSLFRIPAGMYSFDDTVGESSLSSPLPFSLPVPPLMLKGLRAIDDGKLILSVLPPASTRVRVATDPPRGAPLKKLSEAERSVLHIAGAGTEIGEIVRRSELARSMAFRSCFILLSLGLLEAIPDDISPAVVASKGDPAPSEPAVEIEPCSDLIVSQFDKLSLVNERDLLGIRADATREQAAEAYETLKEEWGEVRNQTKDPDLIDKVDAIDLQLATAYARVRLELDNRPVEKPAASGFRTPGAYRTARTRCQASRSGEGLERRDSPPSRARRSRAAESRVPAPPRKIDAALSLHAEERRTAPARGGDARSERPLAPTRARPVLSDGLEPLARARGDPGGPWRSIPRTKKPIASWRRFASPLRCRSS